jgi:hypothetical protein
MTRKQIVIAAVLAVLLITVRIERSQRDRG